MSIENKICRFCLNNIQDDSFNVIDDVTRRLLRMFQLHLDVDVSNNPLMCNKCAIHLKNLFTFKSLVAKVRIIPWTDHKGVKLNIKVTCSVHSNGLAADQTLCHFCIKPRGWGYHTFPAEAKRNIFIVLQRHIPELKLEGNDELVTCRDCLYLLDSLLSFIKRSWDVEERIKRYIELVHKGDKRQIKLSDIRNFASDEIVKKDDPCDGDEMTILKTASEKGCENKFYINEISDTKVDVVENKPLYGEETKTYSGCDSVGEDKPQINEDFVELGTLELDVKSDECENTSRSNEDDTEDKLYCFDEVTTTELDISENKFIYTEEIKTENYCDENRDDKLQIDEIISELVYPELDIKNDESKSGFHSSTFQSLQNATLPLGSASENSHRCPSTSINSLDTSTQKGNLSPFENEYENYLKNTSEIRSDLTLYKCKVCPYQTNYVHHFHSHALYHTFHKHKIYRCGLCGFESIRERSVKGHIAGHRGIDKNPSKGSIHIHVAIFEADSEDYLCKASEKPIKHTIHACKICSYRTHCQKLFLHHKSLCGCKSGANKSQDANEASNMVQNKLIYSEDSKMDSSCYESAGNETQVNQNLPLHEMHAQPSRKKAINCCTNATASTCKICGDKTEKVIHSYTIQYRPREFKCSECQYESKFKHHLAQHILMHKKMYRCEKCPFETKYKRQITLHMIAHTPRSERIMYECDVCPCKTNRLDAIKNHQAKYKKRTIAQRDRKKRQ